ncbi:tripartite motif-containing protein 16-like, partial [Notothenia coriiceps]|uniref:Tripartite motif-containing protein 16-like n=1 Tax=Notothenia coriiceps TaxID=8208 RepID=A0A6I9PS16_9TELE
RVKELQAKLEPEINDLKRRDAELEQLSLTEDHNQFLHSYSSLPALSVTNHSPSSNTRPLRYFEDVTEDLSGVRDKLQKVLRVKWTNISLTEVRVLRPQPEPDTRAGFLKYAREITLDPNTAYKQLHLSKEDRAAAFKSYSHYDNSHSDRFTETRQVLSRESLTGRCYWEVEWIGEGCSVAVAYKSISRAGWSGRFGENDQSWKLDCFYNEYKFVYNSVITPISGPWSSRMGVYLDHTAGILCYYSIIDETMTLLHRVQTVFTQPLYAGIGFNEGWRNIAEVCKLK